MNIATVGTLRAELNPIYGDLKTDSHPLGDQPWRSKLCNEWSDDALPIARDVLGRQDMKVDHIAYMPHIFEVGDIALPKEYHEYLVARYAGASALWVIDGVWQQFQEEPNDEAGERIMIAPTAETGSLISAGGVKPGHWPIWRPDLFSRGVFVTIDKAA